MPLKKFFLTSALLTVLPGMSFACTSPDTPNFPDPKTAELAEMVKSQKELKKYLVASKAYLGCVRSDLKHDAHVAEMKKVADKFNEVSLLYKARVRTQRAVAAN